MVDLLKKHKLERHCCPPIDFCPIPWWKNDRAKPLSHWFEQDDPCRVIQGVQFPSRARVLAEAYCVATFFDSTSIDGFLRFSGDVRQHAQQCPGTLLDYLVKSVDGNSTAPAIQDPEALTAPSIADPTVVPVPSTLVGSPFSQARDTQDPAGLNSTPLRVRGNEITSPTTEDPQEPPADATSTMPDRENWVTRIEKLPRHEVQALAKEYGVKANSATSLIKKSLIEKLTRVSRAGEES